jgi:hypothetical protein
MQKLKPKTIQLDGYRFYQVEDEYFPSVTSILSIKPNPFLERWHQQLFPEQLQAILDYTSTRGEVIHYLALKHYEEENISQGNSPDEAIDITNDNDQMLDKIWRAIDLFHEFQSHYTLEPIYLEHPVWSDLFNYAGRVDFVGYLIDQTIHKKIPVLMDIKTSKRIYEDSVSLQLSAYNQCLNSWATELYALILHPGATLADNISIGVGTDHWQFASVPNNFPQFLHYAHKFRPIAHQILQRHGLLN